MVDSDSRSAGSESRSAGSESRSAGSESRSAGSESRSVDADALSVGDFVEAPDSRDGSAIDVPAAVYRGVGCPPDAFVLLRVTDESGRRVHTGEIVRVDADAVAGFEPASEPRPTVVGFLHDAFQGPYWLVRSLLPF